MRVFMKILKITFIVFLVLTILINVHSLVAYAITGEKVASIGNYSYFTMDSSSMEPEIKNGSLVIIKKQQFYSLDDVVTFYYRDRYITHRIISYDGNNITTKGDTSNDADEVIKESDILGKVTLKIPGIGTFMELLKNPVVIVGIMLLGFCVMLYDTKLKSDMPLQ